MRRIYAFGLSLAALAGLGITHSVLATANAAAGVSAASVNTVAATGLSYTFNPASGSNVEKISEIFLSFPDYTLDDWNWDEPKATFSNGEETYQAIFFPDFEGEALGFTITPGMENSWHDLDETEITTPGKWTLTITGAYCEIGGQKIETPIVAEYTIGGGDEPAPAGELIEIPSITPANGSIVRSLTEVKVIAPDIFNGNWMQPDLNVMSQISVKSGDQEVAKIDMDSFDFGSDWMTGQVYLSFYLTKEITEDGTYTINLPQGTFVETGYNEATDVYEPVAGGYISAAFTSTVTVSENAPFGLSNYTFTPASGSKVDELDYIMLNFPDLTIWDAFDMEAEEMDMITGTISNGTKTYTAYIQLNLMGWGSEELKYMIAAMEYNEEEDYMEPILIEDDGKWVLTIPAGSIKLLDGSSNEEDITAEWYIGIEPSSYTLTPTPGSTIETVEFTLSFPSAKKVEYVGARYNFNVQAGGYHGLPGLVCTEVDDAAVPTFKLTAPADAAKLPNGTITLMIDEGTFEIDGEASEEILATYVLEQPVSTDYILSPESTVVLQDYGFDVALIFDEAARLSWPSKGNVKVTLAGKVLAASEYELNVESNMLMFGFYDTSVLEAGTLTISIAEDAFTIGNVSSPAIEAEWEVVAAKEFEYTVTPEGGVVDGNKTAGLEKITIEFPTATSAEVYNEFGVSLKNSNYTYYCSGIVEIVENETRAEGVKAIVTFEQPITEDGEYTFTMRQGVLTLDGAFESPEIQEVFIYDSTLAGIESILGDENGNVTVVTFDGKVVLENAPASQLRNLKGLYIINGKKALLK